MKTVKFFIVRTINVFHRTVYILAKSLGYIPYTFTKGKLFFSYVFVKKNLIHTAELNNPSVRWEDVDENLQKQFLLNGNSKLIKKHIEEIERIEFNYEKKLINKFIKKANKNFNFYYGQTDKFLFECLKKYPIKNKDVAIMGSTVPWYEAIVLSNSGKPFTFEYNSIQTNDPRLETYAFAEWGNKFRKFDIVISISSFEHDGLGRYGDPINPNGDFEAMANVQNNLIDENGFLILSVPIGKDSVAFNAHRIYGKNRFFKLINGFDIVETFGFEESQFERFKESGNISTKKDSDWPFQPIFVLKINKSH